MAVAVDVGDGQAGWVEAGVVGDGRGEPPPAVPQVDAHRILAQHGDVRDPVVVEVGDADDLGGLRRRDVHGVGEPAASQAGEEAERVRAGVGRHQVGRPSRRERPGHAGRGLHAGHRA